MDRGNPQLEDGYTRIANELLEAFIKECNGPRSIFLAVARETYGFGKKQAEISNKRMCDLTGIGHAHIGRSIRKAISDGYISVTRSGERIKPTYCINKKYSFWKSHQKWLKPPEVVKKLTRSGVTPYKETRKKYNGCALKIIEYLNQISGRKFQPKTNIKYVIPRLKEGFTEEDCKKVIETKWSDPDFDIKYFRPETLFRPSKFEGYLNESVGRKKQERKRRRFT